MTSPFALPTILVGSLPPSGQWVLQFQVPLLPAAVDVIVLHTQSVHGAAGGAIFLGMPETVVVLDGSF